MLSSVQPLALAFFLLLNASAASAIDLTSLSLPSGYTIEIYADNVPDPRQLAIGSSGTVFVGSMRSGTVSALVDRNGDKLVDDIVAIDSGLQMPTGVAYRDGALYVAAVSRILRYDHVEKRLGERQTPVVVYDQLPNDTHHGWKFIAFGPDGRLYVPVGAPCNVCEAEAPYASILSMASDGSDLQVIAKGVRNSVGFDWSPERGELWFTDNGRDWLGDDRPPGELNRVVESGQHFGFPHVHGNAIPDPEFGDRQVTDQFTRPAHELGAHVAPLGIEFYRGSMFPSAVGEVLFVAEHGSWNRSRKAGYRVMRAVIDADGQVQDYSPLVSGWLRGQAHWGRPVDMLTLVDGSLLVSDDHGGRIYRVSYVKPQ